MGKLIRQHFTIANFLATAALVIAASGTAYAAVVYTGANVKNSTLTGADFDRGKITAADLSPAAKRALVGPRGDLGGVGFQGSKGSSGGKGPTGPDGTNANVRASFASWDAGYINTAAPGLNSSLDNWYEWQFGGCTTAPNCHLNAANSINAKPLDGAAAGTTMIDLDTTAPAGGLGSNAGRITTAWQESTVMAWATITLMYRTEGDVAPIHTRAECWMTIDGVKAGPGVHVSAGAQREVETISVIGNAQRGPGTYNAAVLCRDSDNTVGVTRWQAVRANLTMIANEQV